MIKDSDYPPIKLEEFKSQIPPHLTQNATELEQYTLNTLSVISQDIHFLKKAMVDTNAQVRKTNGRLKAVEAWKEKFSSAGAVFIGLTTFVGALAGLVTALKIIFSNFL